MNLTPRQRDLMRYLQSYVDEFGCAPTNQEITDALRLKSKAGTQRLLNGLEERGWLTRIPHRARAITILKRLPDPERRDVVELLAEAERLYSSYGFLANDKACGKWINATREALAKVGRQSA